MLLAIALVSLSAQPPLLVANFDSGPDGFVYRDDLFRGTSAAGYAAGQHVSSGGFIGGALQVELGGIDNNTINGMSGGFTRAIIVPNLGSDELFVELRFRVNQTADYESDEFSQCLVAVDGTLFGQAPFDYATLVIGDGNGGSGRTSYWKRIRLRVGRLAPGSHTLQLGGFNNKKTSLSESTEVLVDEVRVTVGRPADPLAGAQSVVGLTDFLRFKESIRSLASFGDRSQGSSSFRNADTWLRQQLRNVGYTVRTHSYQYQGQPREEVYVTKVGTVYPDRMFLITAHFDGRGGGGAADDDGSGSALVLEAARAFATPGIHTETSVRFVFWNNEETGLQGSSAYVNARAGEQGRESPPNSGVYPEPTWLGLVQHDMILFDHGLPPAANQIAAADMDIEYQAATSLAGPALALASALADGRNRHALRYPAEIGDNMRNTDSWSFRHATAAVSLRENKRIDEIGRGANPHWHKPTDVFATYSDDDFRLGFDILRTTLGTVAELAGAQDSRAHFGTFGQGCAGSFGVPALDALGNDLPWLGESFTLRITALPPTGVVLGVVGASDSRWGTTGLPLHLAVLGMPGCQLLVSANVVLPIPNLGGHADLSFRIPASPVLTGAMFFAQAAAADPTANAGATVVSNGVSGRLGMR